MLTDSHIETTSDYWLQLGMTGVSRKSVFYRNGWTDQASFGAEASFNLSYTVL